MNYEIYTDGATSMNGQEGAKGGWAFSIYEPKEEGNEWIMSGFGAEYKTTNNKMELTAIIEGLAAIQYLVNEESQITIYSDSAYAVNCVSQCWYEKWQSNGWRNSKNEPVKNRELWEQLIPYFEDNRYYFKKVKGHSGVEENEYVDKLAKDAIKKMDTREED